MFYWGLLVGGGIYLVGFLIYYFLGRPGWTIAVMVAACIAVTAVKPRLVAEAWRPSSYCLSFFILWGSVCIKMTSRSQVSIKLPRQNRLHINRTVGTAETLSTVHGTNNVRPAKNIISARNAEHVNVIIPIPRHTPTTNKCHKHKIGRQMPSDFRLKLFYFVPYSLSPASPSPGRIYPFLLRQRSSVEIYT